MNWTTNQIEAINYNKSNTIVSAGAGSGKTAVLTERVIQKVINGTHINELLILTFTNNAAFEMKARIKRELLKNKDLKQEADLIETADITTFDAFVLSLVKKYHYYLNITKNISIIDQSIINKIKKDYISEIFNTIYQEKDFDFENLILTFGHKNDKQIKKTIFELDKNLDLLINKDEYLSNYVKNYYNDTNINTLFNEYLIIIYQKMNSIKVLLNNLSYEVESEYYKKINNELCPLINEKNYDNIRLILNNINLPRITNTTEKGKYYKKQISEILKSLKNDTEYSQKVLFENVINTKNYIKTITDILKKLNYKINNFKTDNNVFEFNDISKMAIKLIQEYDDVKKYLKYHYKEIMIDEYQDTSDIQETFINLIDNNNVYMVGDVKQSIYRFRNANPNIFKIKYDKYKANIDGYKIDLNENFRSRPEVLDSINNIFMHIMDNSIGNANYLQEHQLKFGNKAFINEGDNKQNNNLEIYNYENNEKYSKDEIEAFIVANDIINKIDNKYLVFDNILRPCKYSDFCIIMDRTSSFEIYKKIFDHLNIPLNIYQDTNILMSNEVLIINNIIGLIISIKNKDYSKINFYYTSIARSYLFNISDQQIYDTISNNQVKESQIYQICKNISYEIDYLSNNEILLLIISSFNIYDKLITVCNIEQRNLIINNLLQKFNELNKVNITIYEINDYLNSLLEDKESIKISNSNANSNAVTLINIHKSKGLEYKICYYPGFYKKFNTMDSKKRILFSNDYGIIIPNYKDGFINTFIHQLYLNKYNIDEISEKIRLLYVALTRAKEKMIIVTSLKEKEFNIYDNNEIVDYQIRNNYKSFNDILLSTYKYTQKYIKDIKIPNIDLDYKYCKSLNLNIALPSNPLVVNTIENNNIHINQTHYSKERNVYSFEEYNNIKIGNYIHHILETIDFLNPNISNYHDYEKEIIASLMDTQIFKNISNAKIYQEYEFIYETSDEIKHGIIDLMLEYDDYIDIIDYKLKDITDKAYIKQINGYKEYIELKTKKKVNVYLYSLIDKKLFKI